jgi:hypothetical protein
MYISTFIHIYYTQTYRHTDTHTDRQTDRQTDTHTHTHTHTRLNYFVVAAGLLEGLSPRFDFIFFFFLKKSNNNNNIIIIIKKIWKGFLPAVEAPFNNLIRGGVVHI